MTPPDKFIVSKKPNEYLEQGISHCGLYSIKAMLSSFGMDKKNRPQDYNDTLFGRLTGIATPDKLKSLLNALGVFSSS